MRYEIVEKCHFDDKNAIGQRKFGDVKPFDMRFQFGLLEQFINTFQEHWPPPKVAHLVEESKVTIRKRAISKKQYRITVTFRAIN